MLADIELLAIDLDGTLVDSAPDLAHCLGTALESVDLKAPTEAETRVFIGDGFEKLVERALDHATADEVSAETYAMALESFASCYEQNLFERSHLYPDAVETLDTLKARGIRLCCITNKRLAFAKEILSLASVADRFELVLGGDSVARKKPDALALELAADTIGVSPSQAAMVGDSYHDFFAARDAGYRFIWAAYGYCESIDADGDDKIARIEHFSELAALL